MSIQATESSAQVNETEEQAESIGYTKYGSLVLAVIVAMFIASEWHFVVNNLPVLGFSMLAGSCFLMMTWHPLGRLSFGVLFQDRGARVSASKFLDDNEVELKEESTGMAGFAFPFFFISLLSLQQLELMSSPADIILLAIGGIVLGALLTMFTSSFSLISVERRVHEDNLITQVVRDRKKGVEGLG